MNIEDYSDYNFRLNISDNAWKKEIERLKHDIQKTENKIILAEKRRTLCDKVSLDSDKDFSDAESTVSGNKVDDPCYLKKVERVISDRHLSPGGTNVFRVIDNKLVAPTKHVGTKSGAVAEHATWVSPTNVMRKRPKGNTDCETAFSKFDFPPYEFPRLDQDLASPSKRVAGSPSQEWSSPHRVVDRPKPEDLHGNWIPIRESHQMVVHSPVQGDADSNEVQDEPNRPFSQSTFTVSRNIFTPDACRVRGEKPPVRKISVLNDYEGSDSVPKKKGDAPPGTLRVIPANDKIRRIVFPDGHVVKVSTLDDFSVPTAKNGERCTVSDNPGGPSKTADLTEAKPIKKNTLKKMVLHDIGRPTTGYLPWKAKVIRRTVEEKKIASSASKVENKKEEDQNNKENEPGNGRLKVNEEEREGDVVEVMTELKKILNDRKEGDESSAKRKASSDKRKIGAGEDHAKKARTVAEDKRVEVNRKRRDVDLNAVHKYIKMQKVKRMEQLKTNREKKAMEEEAKKKKLEELRIRTLHLAATSKKKLPETVQGTPMIKVVEPGAETEEDVTMSLGLKQIKPKVSYYESISLLKKKPSSLQKQQPRRQEPPPTIQEREPEIPKEEKTEEEIPLSPLRSIDPAKMESPGMDFEKGTNLTLRKLAETLQFTMEQQKKALAVTSPGRECIDDVEEVADVRSTRKVIAVDVETIQSLKQDIKKISQNFQVLHGIITDKSGGVSSPKEIHVEPIESSRVRDVSLTLRAQVKRDSDGCPSWLRSVTPRPHPYNILTAVRNKMKISRTSIPSETSATSDLSERFKSVSENGSVPVSTNRLFSASTDHDEVTSSTGATTFKSSSRGNYYSLKDDSGSELSSSILDSEKDRFFCEKEGLTKPTDSLKVDSTIKDTSQSYNIETITPVGQSAASVDSQTVKSDRERLILVPPDVQLMTVIQSKTTSTKSNVRTLSPRADTNSGTSILSQISLKSEAVITEIEADGLESVKNSSENAIAKVNDAMNRNFFNPEALHLQFQAELSLLETFQRSLAHFLEMERMKALSGTASARKDKGVNTEEIFEEPVIEERVQEEETELLKTEPDTIKSQEDGTASETDANDQKSIMAALMSEMKSSADTRMSRRSLQKLDFSDSAAGISFQMLNRMMKDEELRSEHQLALIRLREKTLSEKVKAELTLLELRKRALKEKGSSEELAISAIKKKQRGILMKYQHEREDIERLKKMHRIASEERRIMMKQQRQIRQMQLTTKDMLIKLKNREKSPQKKSPIKLKVSKLSDSQLDLQEEISVSVSENTFTESITSVDESINHSVESDLDVTSKSNLSEGEDEILRRNMKTLEEKILKGVDKSVPPKSAFATSEWKHVKRGHSADDLLKWTRRLEEKENGLKEKEREAENIFVGEKHRSMMPLMDSKISVRDRSTSPFQFQDAIKSICNTSSVSTEGTERKKSSSVIELISSNSKFLKEEKESNGKSSQTVPEKVGTSASDDVPEEFSKKTLLTSRSIEYNSESFESSSDTHKSKAVAVRENNANNNAIMIKMALSPRVHSSRRRYSSGSDESINLFHTETASEQSDVEVRIAALQEQLRRRKLEAERLRREQKKAHKERLKAKEQSLLKQIEAYDTYIQKKKQELEQEYEKSSFVKAQAKVNGKSSVKPDDDGISAVRWISRNGVSETDSEIVESIKTRSGNVSVREEIVSDTKKEDSQSTATWSMLESLPMQAVPSDGSHSESEEQTISNASVKTTLPTPEKPDLEVSVETEDIEPSDKVEEENYSEDSFDSDEKSKSTVKESEEERIETEKTSTVEDGEKTEGVEEEKLQNEEQGEEQRGEEEEEFHEDKATETEDIFYCTVTEESVTTEVRNVPEESNRIVDFITESVLEDLLSESMTLMMMELKKAERRHAHDADLDAITNAVAGDIVSEVIREALDMYNRKKKRKMEKEKMQDVRRRVHEIMSQAPGTKREQRRPQDLMVTTYDVPVGAISHEEKEVESPQRQEFLQSLSHKNATKQEKEFKIEVTNLGVGATPQASDVDAYGQEWFDDDFGLSRTRREAEELRVQQIQIEQEIQQLQAQQEQVVYYYLRQIPNKPPPPYTPPGTASAERFTSEREITSVILRVVRYLTDEMNNGRDIGDIQMPESIFNAHDSEHVKCYRVFLYDLAKHIISGMLGMEVQERKLPWMRTTEKLSKFKVKKVERTYECLSELVMKEVLVMFGFKQKMEKERLIVRWSRKKRDHVDELLVGESQEEEADWTHYDEDEVTVKNSVAVGILDSLLEETAQLLEAVWRKKTKQSE